MFAKRLLADVFFRMILNDFFKQIAFRCASARLRRFSFRILAVRLVSFILMISMLVSSTPAALAAPRVFLASASEFSQDARYAYLKSPLANLSLAQVPAMIWEYGFIVSPILALATGLKKSPKSNRQQAARIEISPNRAVIREGEQIVFTAIAYDASGKPVQGARFNWNAVDARGKSPRLALQNGVFSPQFAGSFIVTAETGGATQAAQIRVVKDAQMRAVKETDERLREQEGENRRGANKPKALTEEVSRIMAQPLPAPVRNSTRMNRALLEELDRWDRANKLRKPQPLSPDPQRQMPPVKRAAPAQRAPSNQSSQLENAIEAPDAQVAARKGGPRLPEEAEEKAANKETAVTEETASVSAARLFPSGEIQAIDPTTLVATGCAYDYDFGYLNVEFYIGDMYSGTYIGSSYATSTNANCYPTNSGFEFQIPSQYADGQTHALYAYVWSISDGMYYQLNNSPMTFSSGGGNPPPGNPNWNNTNFPTADDPGRQPGNPANNGTAGAGSSNFSFSAPVLSLGGRGDLDLSLSLNYNSLLWHQAGGEIIYDIDKGFPAPGWNIGFGKLMDMDTQGGSMLETPDGTRHSYEGVIQAGYTTGYSTYYGRTTDGSFIDYVSYRTPSGISGGTARLPNGTVITYGAAYNGVAYPTQIKDRHGNYVSISYRNNQGPRIQAITDNLGRIIQFNYDSLNRLISITGPGINNTPRTFVRLHYRQLTLNYSFDGLTPLVRDANPYVIDAIYYPVTNTGYWFGDADSYSSYGMITKVVEQRGMGFADTPGEQGAVTPGATNRQMIYNYPLQPASLPSAPQYTTMTESWDRSDTPAATTTYSVNNSATPRTTSVTMPNGTIVRQSSYNNPNQWNDGLLYQVETISPQNQVLSKTMTAWQLGDYNSPRVTEVLNTDEKNQTTRQTFSYDAYYNQLATAAEYGYANNLLRTKVNTYENGTNYRGFYTTIGGMPVWSSGRHIFSLVKTEEIVDANNVRLSRTEYNYDQAQLLDTPNVVMYDQTYNPHNPNTYQGDCLQWEWWYDDWYCVEYEQVPEFDSATLARGNLTQTISYENAQALTGAVAYDFTYDITGNSRTATTACCQQVSFNYTQNTQYSQPESHTKGSSDPNSPHRMTETAVYDFNTGLMTSATDFNGRTTAMSYDAVNRPLQVTFSTGGKQTFEYNDANLSSTQTLLEANNNIASKATTVLNGRGQAVNTAQMAGASWNVSTVKYDLMGRRHQVSMPYDASQSPSQWTTFAYDFLNRVTQVTMPDGSQSKTFYNENSRPDSASQLAGQTIRSQDAWGRERWARTDDFGRLVEVVEPNPNGNGSVFETGSLQTSYVYDALDQLITVYQGEQQRWFAYDSLGRLTRQKLAEQAATINSAGQFVGNGGAGAQWSDAFFYDSRSNLIQRIDARGVKTNFNYQLGGSLDSLNRLQSISFDKTQADATYPIWDAAAVSISYMTSGDKTRVQSVVANNVSTETNNYDIEGRISDYTLTLASRTSHPFTTSYLYDTVNRLTEVRYPNQYGMSGNPRKTVNPFYDNASRLAQLAVNNQIQMNEIIYNPMSQVTQLKTGAATGNADVEQYSYDNQTSLLVNQKVIKANTNQTLLDLSYNYNRGNSNGSINGKTGQLTHIVNNLDRNKDRVYEFDAFGRLRTAKGGAATGVQGVTANWTQNYTYDRYGNRETVTANGITANNQSVPTDGLPTLSYHRPSNRINTIGYEYDLAGNQTRGQSSSGQWQRFEYDAAGRLVKIKDDNGNVLESYTYAADRKRLINETPSQRTYYAWGGSSVLCEYVENAQSPTNPVFRKSYIYAGSRLLSTQTNNNGVETEEFHHPDRLGTRLVTNNQANSSYEQSTLPFGTALNAESTGFTNQVFTSYDRSAATGLDYAVNRTYNSGQSRFTSVDPIGMAATEIGNPQSLNLYAYVENNPIDFVDPSGLCFKIYYIKVNGQVVGTRTDFSGCAVTIPGGDGGITGIFGSGSEHLRLEEPSDPENTGGTDGGGIPDKATLDAILDQKGTNCREFLDKVFHNLKKGLTVNGAYAKIKDIYFDSSLETKINPDSGTNDIWGEARFDDEGNRTIALRPLPTKSKSGQPIKYAKDFSDGFYARVIFHELMHHAANSGRFSHSQMAKAVRQAIGIKKNPKGVKDSTFVSQQINAHCPNLKSSNPS